MEIKPPTHSPTDLGSVPDLLAAWSDLYGAQKLFTFTHLTRHDAEILFEKLSPKDQAELIAKLPTEDRKIWIRSLSPSDAAKLFEQLPEYERETCSSLLDVPTREAVHAHLAYAEDTARGLMNVKFARLRSDMTVDEAINFLRVQAREKTLPMYYGYVCGAENFLEGIVSLRMLFEAPPGQHVREIMVRKFTVIPEAMDQEEVSTLFSRFDFVSLPVVDRAGNMKGVVTADEIVGVVRDEATEDIQKMGAMEALDAPYFVIPWPRMIKKRAGWLMALFIGEMFTATAMGYYEKEISKAIVLALFIPLIISSGGNSGSQATTLIIRAMALGEIKLREWWKVFIRELFSGLALGVILGSIGLLRILLWPNRESLYGEHYFKIAITVAFSLVGIVLWGTLIGSMLPFVFRRLGFDPASASAPFVATLVDVTGLVIYFTVASVVLTGTLL